MAASFLDLDSLLDTLGERSFEHPPALISNAHITGLGVARALDTEGIPVIALDRNDGGVAFPSNAVDLAGEVTYPLDDLDGFRADIEAIVDAIGHEVVAFGCMDEWVHAYAQAEPDGVRLPSAEHAVVDRVLNKSSLYRMAEALDVPYPETYRLGEYAPEEITDRLTFPFVVKPELKREFEEAIGTNVIEVADADEFETVIDRAATHDVAIMAQERVPIAQGEDRSLVSYVPNSTGSVEETLALVGNPVVRYPRSFGTSCVVDRVDDPTVERHALSILEEAGYHGISEAEFVYDRERGRHVLLDINTRPWKWISMPVAAGFNLPFAAYVDAIGLEFDGVGETKREQRWVYLRDFLATLAEEGGVGLFDDAAWSALATGRFEAADSTLTTGVYRPSDPGPIAKLLTDGFAGREYYCAC